MGIFHYQKDNCGIVTITMDMTGPVNTMNAEFDQLMSTTMDKLESEAGLSGVIFASGKKDFFAGGDLKEILAVDAGQAQAYFAKVEAIKGLLRRLEKLPVPVVAAMNGAALGGGYELCLGCNYRIALNDKRVQIGLPEVALGLLPGGGGIVRMTHLLGVEKAMPLLLEGQRLKAQQALAEGLVDELVDSPQALMARACTWLIENRDNPEAAQQPWDRKGYRIKSHLNRPSVAQAFQWAPFMVMGKTRGLLPAPERILETVLDTLRVDFDTALRIESRNFISLVISPQAKNMVRSFFFQMNQVNGGASRPEGIPQSPVKKLGIIGAGMMGQGIANVAAMAGMDVVLKDVSLEGAEKGKAYTARLLDKAIARGKKDEADKEQVLNRILATDQDSDLAGCDLIIEAVFEQLGLKHQVTRETQQRLAEGGIWGTNTSSLPITRLAEASDKPENFVGIHFFSPVDKMPLVELICGDQTSSETLARAFDFVRQIHKTPIVVNDNVGFYTSRTFATQLYEAAQMVAEGIHPVRIDSLGKAMGMPVGPLTVHDEVSLQLTRTIEATQRQMGLKQAENDPTPLASQLVEELVTQYNRGGRYHGEGGYFDYSGKSKTIWPGLLKKYYQPQIDISDQDIKDRLLFRCVIESLKCLQEGILRSVADGNVGSLLGIGAPAWTGGYIQFVNTYGLQAFVARCDELDSLYGDRFKAPNIVSEYLGAGKHFY